jgi:hypothetical protein
LVGYDARFECRIKANPLTNHYWMKDDEIINNALINPQNYHHTTKDWPNSNQNKYEINIYNQNSDEYLMISALVVKVNYYLISKKKTKILFFIVNLFF